MVGLVAPWIGATPAGARGFNGGASAPLPILPFDAVNGPVALPQSVNWLNGWSVHYIGAAPDAFAPLLPPFAFNIRRPGFTTAGVATVYDETAYITQGVRQPWPNQVLPLANTAACSTVIYADDSIPAQTPVVNNSTMASPKPVANWAMMSQTTIGNTLHWEIVAGHRNVRNQSELACVIPSATDGVTTVTGAPVTNVTISTNPIFRHPTLVYAGDLDITTLTDVHLVTLNAKCYPWIGNAASINDSSTSVEKRGFSPRYYRKDVAKAAAPPLAYLDVAGNDGTGVWSTVAATASFTPFLTYAGAMNALTTAPNLPVTGGIVDGCELRLKAGTFLLGNPAANRTQNISGLTITRDPALPDRTTAILTYGATFGGPRITTAGLVAPLTETAVFLHDITILRTGAQGFIGTVGMVNIYHWDVTFDNQSFAGSILSSSAPGANQYTFGMTVLNPTATRPFQPAATNEHRAWLGVNCTVQSDFEDWFFLGCDFFNVKTSSLRSLSGVVKCFSKYTGLNDIAQIGAPGGSADFNGYLLAQNVIETVGAPAVAPTQSPAFLVSADNTTGNGVHMCNRNNTYAGYFGGGRVNIDYDEGGTERSSTLGSFLSELWVQCNTKGDRFVTDSNRLGNWQFLYGVDCRYNMTQYVAADSSILGANFSQAYGGLGYIPGQTNGAANPNPLFVAPAAMTWSGAGTVGTGGAGGGNYQLQAGSPCKNVATGGPLPFDFIGVARPTVGDSVGAYV